MSETLTLNVPSVKPPSRVATSERIAASLNQRHAAEKRFRVYGGVAIAAALACLGILLFTIVSGAIPAFTRTMVILDIHLDASAIDPDGSRLPDTLAAADYRTPSRQAMRDLFPGVKERRDKRQLLRMLSSGIEFAVRDAVLADPTRIGRTLKLSVPLSDDMDQLNKGAFAAADGENGGRISNKQRAWFAELKEKGRIETKFNWTLFTAGDSREPELAGMRGAVVGSLLTMLVTLLLSFPVGVASAVYLEEFASKNRWTQLIEVNINNLAAVPSIVFGLLGLAVFLNFFGLPRSAPLVGGMVLALMTLPTVIIAARASMKSVPPSIREAAFGMGASPMQVVAHHVLPLALPGILTGTIIGMARALGETAPLLMIGMVAFIVDIPGSVTDPSTVLPVQIYLWADSPERAFVEKTAAVTLVLVGFLIAMNALAVVMRNKFERKW